MQKAVKLEIGEVGIRFRWKGEVIKNPKHAFYKNFVVNDERKPHSDLEIYQGKLPEHPREQMIFDAIANHWRMYVSGERHLIEIFSPRPPHPKTNVVLMERDFGTGELWAKPVSFPFQKLMRPLGEILITNHLARGKGVLAHALGLVDDGCGMVFFGASGTGKSTLANLYKKRSKDTLILSDEKIIIRKDKAKFWLYGTPWSGNGFSVSSGRAELKKIFFIEHGRQNRLIPERSVLMAGRMFQQLFLPFWDKEKLAFALRFSHELVESVPSHRLAFVNDEKVIDFVRAENAKRSS
jgi:hypothetical protein